MSDLSKKQLDDLFREGTERHDFEYNPVAWARLEQLLERDVRRRKALWWVFGLLASVLLVIISVVLWLGQSSISDVRDTVTSTIANPSPSGPVDASAHPLGIQDSVATFSSPVIDPEIDPSTPHEGLEETEPFENRPQTISSPSSVNSPVNRGPEIQEDRRTETIDQTDLIRLNSPVPVLPPAGTSFPQKITVPKETQAREVWSVPPIAILEPKLTLPVTTRQLPQNAIPDGENRKTNLQINRLMIGLQTGMDWGAPKLTNFSDPSWNLGLQLEYQYKWHYSIMVGLTYSNKSYLAAGKQYDAPPGFWQGSGAADWVNGDCRMLEVPVQLGYYVRGYRQSGLYVAAGLTSYLMLKEQYAYSFDQIQPGQILSWEGNRQNQHWFGIGHFSLGYQQALSPKASVQFAPYLQVPFTGIGHGEVWLYTVGAHLRFSFQAF